MDQAVILLVEDDERLARRIATFLGQHHYEVHIEGLGGSVLQRLKEDAFDLVILDWMLPDINGIELCPLIKEVGGPPVLMLTARFGDQSEVAGLEVGADDYLAKPVRPPVLLARIHALLRRAGASTGQGTAGEALALGALTVDPGQRCVSVSGRPIELTTAEYDLLHLLASNAGRVLSREELYLSLRGIPYDGLDRSMDLRVSRIRRKLHDQDPDAAEQLKSIRGVGYMVGRPP